MQLTPENVFKLHDFLLVLPCVSLIYGPTFRTCASNKVKKQTEKRIAVCKCVRCAIYHGAGNNNNILLSRMSPRADLKLTSVSERLSGRVSIRESD